MQVCENNCIRRNVGEKRADKIEMDELRVEVGVWESFKEKLMMSRLKLAEHMERMRDKKLAKGADAQEVEGKRR